MSKILTDIIFSYVPDIPHSTCTLMSNNLIKCCWRDHLLEGILKGLRVRAAGLLKLFIVSINDLVCQLCIGCWLSLSNNGTKLCVIPEIFFVTSYFLTGYHTYTIPLDNFYCWWWWTVRTRLRLNLGRNSHNFFSFGVTRFFP